MTPRSRGTNPSPGWTSLARAERALDRVLDRVLEEIAGLSDPVRRFQHASGLQQVLRRVDAAAVRAKAQAVAELADRSLTHRQIAAMLGVDRSLPGKFLRRARLQDSGDADDGT